jgi:hypothetical protein
VESSEAFDAAYFRHCQPTVPSPFAQYSEESAMSVDLMELAQRYFTKDVISQMSGVLGESPEKTGGAIGGSLAAILGGLMKKSSSAAGAEEIMRVLDDQDDSILDNLGDLFGGGNTSGLMDAGSGVLKVLFGGGWGSVIDVLTKSTGLGGKSMTSLLSMLAPIVMSLLKRQRDSLSLDAGGMANLLAGQTEFIASALPSGFGDLLGLSGFASSAADTATPAVGRAAEAVTASAGAVASGARQATNSAASAGGSLLGKLMPLIALVALALIAWQLFKPRPAVIEDGGTVEVEAFDESANTAPVSEDLKLEGPLLDETQNSDDS